MAEETLKDKVLIYAISAILTIVARPFILIYLFISWLIDTYRIGCKLAWVKYYKRNKFERYERINQARWRRIDKEKNGWPTDPVERAKCPRMESLNDDEFECNGYIEDSLESLVYVANESCQELEELFINHIDELNQWASSKATFCIYSYFD